MFKCKECRTLPFTALAFAFTLAAYNDKAATRRGSTIDRRRRTRTHHAANDHASSKASASGTGGLFAGIVFGLGDCGGFGYNGCWLSCDDDLLFGHFVDGLALSALKLGHVRLHEVSRTARATTISKIKIGNEI